MQKNGPGAVGRPRKTRGGQVVSVWLGIDEIRLLRAWAAYNGHASISAAIRAMIREGSKLTLPIEGDDG